MRNNNSKVLETITAVTLIDNSTIEIHIDQDIEFELEHAIQLNDKIYEIGGNRKFYQLTIFGNRSVPTKEARSYSISQEGSRFKMAEAIVVKTLSQKMVFNFMINVERPSVRTKLFTCPNEAREWLGSLNS
ncbi:MAG: hypothetical protein P8P74_14505 [Crocinitomicaceae bacterium]|nr:hypothetical protein [Crocinitomicaceae bacterium]